MKKLILLLLCTATLGLASCKKETLIDPSLPNETFEKVIKASDWRYIENDTRLTYTVPMPEIDETTFKHDAVLVYIYPDNELNEYKPLPFTFDGQAYSCTVRPGSITVDIQTSGDNILKPVKPTIPVGLRVVIVTSNLN